MSNFDTQRANINNQLAVSNNLIYRFSQKLSLKANISFLNDKITFLENNNTFFNTSLKTENIFWNNKIQYTYKISNNKALQYISNFSIKFCILF